MLSNKPEHVDDKICLVIVFICLHLADLTLQNNNIHVTYSSNIAHNVLVIKMPLKYDIWTHGKNVDLGEVLPCLLYTSPSPRDRQKSRMPSSA